MISTQITDLKYTENSAECCFAKFPNGEKNFVSRAIIVFIFFFSLCIFPKNMVAQCVTCTNNLVINGGFNTNTASWTSSNGNFYSGNPYPQCNTAKHAMIQRTSGTAQFYQDVTGVSEGATLQFSFWGGVHVNSFDAKFGLEFYSSNTPSAGTKISESKLQVDKILSGNPIMQFYTTSMVVPAGTVKIRVIGTATGDWLKVDEVCLQSTAPSNLCVSPSPNSACTPPGSWNADLVVNGKVDWQTFTGINPENVTTKIRLTGNGTITVKNKNLTLNSGNAVIFLDGPNLVIDNGCLLLPASGSKYIQNCGSLQVTGGFLQSPNSVVCISGANLEIGQEKAGSKFTSGATYTSAAFINEGGYRYINNSCVNTTSHFTLKSTGNGSGVNGVDLIKSSFFEIGDAGINHARTTPIGSYDSEDAGNWESFNTQSIYGSTIIVAKGNFVKTDKISIYCDVNVKVNYKGNFHVNSGTVSGTGLRVAIENDFGNCGNWTLTSILWYSALQKTSNVPGSGTESTLATLTPYFAGGCNIQNCSNNGNNNNNQNSCAEVDKVPFAAGAYIINMGVTPQTDNNALKPYGMIYDLIKNYNVKIIWIIKPDKEKDGVDFKYNGIDFKGGPFLIPSEYRTPAINARINYWQSQGVVGTTTISELKLCSDHISRELKNVPRWTLDKKNGQLAVEYFINAGIPENAYGGNNGSGWKNPSELNCCDDLFVLPHAEPSWAVHQRLYTWNLECKGGIWDGCTSGSAIENMVNPANRNEQTNFLTVKDPSFKGTSGIYANSNTLMLWSTHQDGTPPYTHRLPSDPVAQYISTTDGAHTNGAEQIYIPRQTNGTPARWNPSVKILAYDPNHPVVTNLNPDLRNAATPLVYGRGFEDTNRGYVMHSAGHSYDKGSTTPAHIAAQRAFFNFSWLVAQDKAETINFESAPEIVNAGVPTRVDISLGGGADLSGFSIVWSSNCGGTFSPSPYVADAEFIPPHSDEIVPCIVTVSITDPCGRTTTDSRRVEFGCDYKVNPVVTNPTCAGSSNGSIVLEITGESVYGANDWVWNNLSSGGTGSGNSSTISGLSSGSYNVTVTSFTGCSATFTALLAEPRNLDVTSTATNYACQGQTGTIMLNVFGGNAPYQYLWNDGSTVANKESVVGGTYTVTVTDLSGCTATSAAQVAGPSLPLTVDISKTDITCAGGQNGTISINVTGQNGAVNYLWSDAVTTKDRTALIGGSYMVTVSDASGCSATASTTINQPSALAVSIMPQHPTCPAESGNPLDNDGNIVLSVSGGTLPYSYLWNDNNTTKDRNNLPEGTYSVTITDAKGCQIIRNIALNSSSTLPKAPSGINK